MNKIRTTSSAAVELYCYDNIVDISDETETIPDIDKMEPLRKAVVKSLQRLRNERNRIPPSHNSQDGALSLSTGHEARDVWYIKVSKRNEMVQPIPQSQSAAERSHEKGEMDTTVTTNLLNDECREWNDAELGKISCVHLKALDKDSNLKDAKSVSHVIGGSVIVTDFLGNNVTLFDASGKVQRKFNSEKASAFTEPWAAAMTTDDHVAVTFRRQGCVGLWASEGKAFDILGNMELQSPCGLAVDESGRIVVTDEAKNDVFIFDRSGQCLFKITDFHETSFKHPRYVCCSCSGRIIVSDSGNHCVQVFDRDGQLLFKFGSFGRNDGQFKFPYGVCVDQQDSIIVADHYNDRVVMFSANGQFVQNLVTSSSGIKRPYSVCCDCTDGGRMYLTHGELKASSVDVFKLETVDIHV